MQRWCLPIAMQHRNWSRKKNTKCGNTQKETVKDEHIRATCSSKLRGERKLSVFKNIMFAVHKHLKTL